MPPTRRYHVPSALRRSSARVDLPTARTLLAQGAVLIDVRRRDDPVSPLEGALAIPPDEIPPRVRELPRASPIVLACT